VVNEITGEAGLAFTLGNPGIAKTYPSKIIVRFNEEVLPS
jgi:hypothetical protein